jgi:phosphoglycolate phosphatase-like HAD superfamily hydrolase
MIIFWDFDGVIKDSVQIKSKAFGNLFAQFGNKISKRVIEHHESNGGMSRFEKIPIYLGWSGVRVTPELIEEYLNKFSILVKSKVIESDWVPGVLEVMQNKKINQLWFIVTATPQDEIEEIINHLELNAFFQKIIGAPIMKSDAIKSILQSFSFEANDAIMIGDSISDYQAAVKNNVTFILRKTTLNKGLQKKLDCIMIDDFLDNCWDSFNQNSNLDILL